MQPTAITTELLPARGIDVNERTVTTRLYSLIQVTFGHNMACYVYFLSLIGHILS